MSMMPVPKRDDSKGFSLLEILITIMILSIGLMGVISLQLKASESTNGAYFRSQATLIADELAERMHVNSVGKNSYSDINPTISKNYCEDNRPVPFCESEKSLTAASCNPVEMAVFDIFRAACDVSKRLPSGNLKVEMDGSMHSIIVSWDEVDEGEAIASNVTIKVLL